MILALVMIGCAVVLVAGLGFAWQAEAASKRLGHTDGGPFPGGG